MNQTDLYTNILRITQAQELQEHHRNTSIGKKTTKGQNQFNLSQVLIPILIPEQCA